MINKTEIIAKPIAMLNTTYSGIQLKHDYFNNYMLAIKTYSSSVICDSEGTSCGSRDLSCQVLNETLPPLDFILNGTIYSFPVLAYAKDGFDGLDSGCSLMIEPSKEQNNADYSITLGIAFMK